MTIEEHQGFRGKLDPTICDTTPYYADRTIEFLVNTPYLLKVPESSSTTATADNGSYNSPYNNMKTVSRIHQYVSSDDHVCVIWIEDLTNYTELARRIKMSSSNNSKAMVFIFINPLKNSGNGLFWIRILIPSIGNNATSVMASQRLNENALVNKDYGLWLCIIFTSVITELQDDIMDYSYLVNCELDIWAPCGWNYCKPTCVRKYGEKYSDFSSSGMSGCY